MRKAKGKNTGLGRDPFAAMTQAGQKGQPSRGVFAKASKPAPSAKAVKTAPPEDAQDRARSKASRRLNVVLSSDELITRVKAAVLYTPGETLVSLTERALEAEVARMEKVRGEAFPTALAILKPGRPIKL